MDLNLQQTVEERILRVPDIRHLTGLSRSTIWRLEKEGHFPKRLSLGQRAVGWRKTEVIRWMQSR